jgi:cyanate permease
VAGRSTSPSTSSSAGASAVPGADVVLGTEDTHARWERAKRGVAVVFGVNGFLFATWISRLPAVRDLLHVSPGRLGLLLFSVSVGSVSTLPVAGFFVHRLGTRRACLSATTVMICALAVCGATPAIPLLVVALALVGIGTGLWDVSMNVEGAGVERLLGRAVMPRFHAGWSLGSVAGAGGGALAAALGVPVWAHVGVLAAVGWGTAAVAVRRFVGADAWGVRDEEEASDGGRPAEDGADDRAVAKGSGIAAAWREPRTLAIGLLALGMAFCEGSANDWLALGLVDGYRVDHAIAALGFGLFVTAMTGARMVGPWTLERWGRVRSLRWGAAAVLVGVLAFVGGSWLPDAVGLVPALVLAAAGALAWGTGAALGFPVAMSAASDDPRMAAARVGVVSTVGYTAFLAGPPLLGLLGDHVGVVRALLGVVVAVLLSLVCAGAARRPRSATPSGDQG